MRYTGDNMVYRLRICSEFDDGSRCPLYYELDENLDRLKEVASNYAEDNEFNKKIIETYASSLIVVVLEELKSDGDWVTLLEYVDFL